MTALDEMFGAEGERAVAFSVQVEVFERHDNRPFLLTGKDVIEHFSREARTAVVSGETLTGAVSDQLAELVEVIRRQLAVRYDVAETEVVNEAPTR